MVMLGPHYFVLSSESTTYIIPKAISQYEVCFIYGSLRVCDSPMNSPHQFYDNHSISCDKIEAWLEESYLGRFPMNNSCDILGMMDRGLQDLIFPISILLLLQFLLLIIDEHVSEGLELHGWMI